MFKKIRIAFLLLCLFCVSVGAYKDMNHNWDKKTVVVLHPINADNDPLVQEYIDKLRHSDFDVLTDFMKKNSMKYHKNSVQFEFRLGRQIQNMPTMPSEETAASVKKVILWSLGFRLYGWMNKKIEDFGSDAVMYLVYYNVDKVKDLSRSTALQKGRIGIVNLYAQYVDQNKPIILHETLHTLGAVDYYSFDTGFPEFPNGIAEPAKIPLYPQSKAEIMGGYIPLNDQDFIIPPNIDYVVMGPATAAALGWSK